MTIKCNKCGRVYKYLTEVLTNLPIEKWKESYKHV